MLPEYTQLLANLDRTSVPDGVLAATYRRIELAARARARRRLVVTAAGTFGAGGLTAAAGYYIVMVLQTTGFYYYASLLAPHDLVIFAHWQDIALSLLATVPLFEVSIFLFGLTLFVWSATALYATIRRTSHRVYA